MTANELRSLLMILSGVNKVKIEENRMRDTLEGIAAHSSRVTVSGGDDREIARVLALQVVGMSFVGEVEVSVGTRLVRFSRGGE